jgi:tRNA-specific 2-thiouridylase
MSNSLSIWVFLPSFHVRDVKALAAGIGLPNATRKESMGICFIGKRRFDEFLGEYITPQMGNFINIETGEDLGPHKGISFYTLGQSASIAGKSVKYFVTHKETTNGNIYVCAGSNHPALFADSLTTKSPHWITAIPTLLQVRNELVSF